MKAKHEDVRMGRVAGEENVGDTVEEVGLFHDFDGWDHAEGG